jgi:hypothetical protein
MKNALLQWGLLVIILISLANCASFTTYRYKNSVEGIIEAINQGDVQELLAQSSVPFLVDQEIMLLPKDLELFWHNLVAKKFILKNPLIRETLPVDKQTFSRFATTMEVESFFANYISPKAYWVNIETSAFRLALLLDRGKGRKIVLKGWKGPASL